jgi:hypothetical protein
VTRIPIACGLTSADATDRSNEWQRFLADHVGVIQRSETSARLRLNEGDSAVLAATDLARREKACCPFFVFRLVPLVDAVWLEIDAPAEAAAIVDQLIESRGA